MDDKYEVTISFPLGAEPFHDRFSPSTTVGAVRSEAMKDFGVLEEPASVFYLSHNGERAEDSMTLSTLSPHARGLKFRLVKELIQGHDRL
jgi:hypothetical protein